MTYEQAVTRLEEVIGLLDNDKTPLEDALSLYREGIDLLKKCNEKLNSAEQIIKLAEKENDDHE